MKRTAFWGFLSISAIGAVGASGLSDGVMKYITERFGNKLADQVVAYIKPEEWYGLEKEPKPSERTANQSGCGPISNDNLSQVEYRENIDTWNMHVFEDSSVSANVSQTVEGVTSSYIFKGKKYGTWIVLSYQKEGGNGHGVIYLEHSPDKEYYTGYQISDDCHDNGRKVTAILCPYILFKKNTEDDARKDGVLKSECRHLYR
jgi:hypothetical protein